MVGWWPADACIIRHVDHYFTQCDFLLANKFIDCEFVVGFINVDNYFLKNGNYDYP